jgi:uncharacterized delta-60 repeat protein
MFGTARLRRGVTLIGGVLAALLVAGLAGNSSVGMAASAGVDSTFGTGGRTVVDQGGSDPIGGGRSLALQSDGKIVVSGVSDGDVTLLRLDTNGNLDTTFSDDGKVKLDFGGSEGAQGVAIQPDGKIVIVGQTDVGGTIDLLAARFNPNGSLDTSFDVDGWTVVDLGGADIGTAAAIQPDGKIVVVGFRSVSSLILVRFNANGSLDTTFNGSGQVVESFGGTAYGIDLALQPDGKIVVSGNRSGDLLVARYTTTGTLDTSFGSGGWTAIDFGSSEQGSSVALQPDGKIVVGGASGAREFVLARFDATGALDPSCDTDGKVNLQPGGPGQGFSLALQPGGKILLGGYTDAGDLAVVRLNGANCGLDSSFGTAGVVTADFGAQDFAQQLALQPDGKIVLAGAGNVQGTDQFVVRLLSDPAAAGTSPVATLRPPRGVSTSTPTPEPTRTRR